MNDTKDKMKISIHKIILSLTIFGFLLVSCNNSEDDVISGSCNLTFISMVFEGANLTTRAPSSSSIDRKDFDLKFYIERKVGEEKKCATYIIPQNRPGALVSYANADSLNWMTATGEHLFYSWTCPWGEDSYKEDYIDGTRISFNQNDKMYEDVSDNKNCKVLETFIGAKAGPVSYDKNGEYVELQFQHLVSRIYIQKLQYTYTEEDGSVKYVDVNDGTITFTNMPAEAIFTREGDGRPVVKANPDGSMNATYSVGKGVWLYVCPDVDYSNVEFRINAPSIKNDAGSYGEFLGDFKSISFMRDLETDWWDNAHPGTTTLYAGEEMYLNMILRRGAGVVINVAISPWDTRGVREASAYPYLGIYDRSDLENFYNTFKDGYTDESEERMFATYGDQDDKEYKLYDDLTHTHARLPMGKKYPLNGMGHTITFSTTNSNSSSHGNNYVGVPKVHDIYLSDGKGHTVYIDDNYKVFIVNEDGSMTETGFEMTPLTGNNVKYYIDLETGKVTQTASP